MATRPVDYGSIDVDLRGGSLAERSGVRSPGGRRKALHLEPGDRVTHDADGVGTVIEVERGGDKSVAKVAFGSDGVKRLDLRYAPIVKL